MSDPVQLLLQEAVGSLGLPTARPSRSRRFRSWQKTEDAAIGEQATLPSHLFLRGVHSYRSRT